MSQPISFPSHTSGERIFAPDDVGDLDDQQPALATKSRLLGRV